MGKYFTEPLGSKLPALEQNVLKVRAMNMILVMFYAENLKRTVVHLIQATDDIRIRIHGANATPPRVPPGTKNPVDKALSVLVADAAITAAEKEELVKLIDYRNFISHQVHNLLADVGGSFAHKHAEYPASGTPKYDGTAVKRLRHFRRRIDGLYRTHHYVGTVSFDYLAFEAAEKTFLQEIRRLRHKIARLTLIRRGQVKAVGSELSLEGTGLEGDNGPGHPLNRHASGERWDGRLTKRGIEIVYKLFELGKSSMAVAHLTGLSFAAVRKRRKMWAALGKPKK